MSLTGQNVGSSYTYVQFDISWDNSWRTSNFESNWDAAWLFIKYKKTSSSEWEHATIHTSDFTAPIGSTIDVTSDGKGALMYRSAD